MSIRKYLVITLLLGCSFFVSHLCAHDESKTDQAAAELVEENDLDAFLDELRQDGVIQEDQGPVKISKTKFIAFRIGAPFLIAYCKIKQLPFYAQALIAGGILSGVIVVSYFLKKRLHA